MGERVSTRFLKRILQEYSNIVCLLGKGPAAEQGCDFYREDFIYDIEARYGRSPSEIVNSTFYNNRPETFYRFYREEILKKRGEPDEVNYSLKRMEDDGKLRGIVTRGFFDLSRRAGCHNIIHLYGNIDSNFCPHCHRRYDAQYILDHKPIPVCSHCGTMIHPGIALTGEMLDSQVMTRAIEIITSADVLLVIGAELDSNLGSMAKYFNGDRICLVNNTSHYSDETADCICIGNIQDIMHEVYPSGRPYFPGR
ncbi:MAG: Sir2 family NAD-dependent protein deacetylase [Eubacteriales bacterium]